MSLLRRIGTSRNNIDWYNASSNSSGKYLRRTSTGRNNISWLQVSTSGTYNILNRTSSGRNNIQWKNTVFNFGGDLTKIKGLIYTMSTSSGETQANTIGDNLGYYFANLTVTKNTISGTRSGPMLGLPGENHYKYQFGIITGTSANATTIRNELLKFNKISIGSTNANITGTSKTTYYSIGRGGGYGALVETSSSIRLNNINTITFS